MPRVVASTEIAAPAEKVWEVLSDPNRYPELVPVTQRMLDVPDEMGVGAVYREFGGIKPFVGDSEWRVTEFDPPRHQTHIGDDGSATFHMENDIEPSGSGSRLTQTFDVKPRWYIAPLNAVLWPIFMREKVENAAQETVANIKKAAEAEAA